ncbi:MAG: hypothetical protein ABIP39_03555 [Polyangiaceae bacterium]
MTDNEMIPSAAALGRYISAFRARILLAVLAYCFALVAVAVKSPRLGEISLVVAPALSLVTGLAMAAGVLAFSRLPQRIKGKGMARLSFALLLLSASFSAYAVLLALPTVGVTVVPASLDAQAAGAFSAVWRLPWVELASQAAMLVSLLALLASFAGVASSLDAKDMARRAARAFNVVALATTLAIALGYFEVRGFPREVVVLGGITVLVVALIGVAKTFGVARYVQVYVTSLGITQRASEAPLNVLAWRNA